MGITRKIDRYINTFAFGEFIINLKLSIGT